MKVTACIISFNTAEHLPGAIEGLLAQDHADLEVVVIDNDSQDGSADVARRYPDVRVVANPVNRGFAGAANQGVELAGDGGLFLANPDIRLDPRHVSSAVASLRANPRAATVQGRLWRMRPDGSPQLVDGLRLIDTTGHTAHTNRVFRNRGMAQGDHGQFDEPAEIFGVSGCAALYRTEALHDIAIRGEVFDDDMFAFFEDIDVDWRLRARGWQAWYCPDATGLHERGGEGVRRSLLVERLSFRNWFFTVLKNDDPRSMARQAHLVTATTVLRTVDIAVTVPSAFLAALGDTRMIGRFLRKRREIEATRTVDNRRIVADWFGEFDYRAWFEGRFRRGWRG